MELESTADYHGFGGPQIINLIGQRCLDNAAIKFIGFEEETASKLEEAIAQIEARINARIKDNAPNIKTLVKRLNQEDEEVLKILREVEKEWP